MGRVAKGADAMSARWDSVFDRLADFVERHFEAGVLASLIR